VAWLSAFIITTGGQISLLLTCSQVVAVSCSCNHAVALLKSGKAVAWGANNYGQSTVPEAAVTAVAAGHYFLAFLLKNGSLITAGIPFS
jgi:hypothetical protein